MSKVVEYVGVLHTLKERVLEAWTQFWATPDADESEEKESNFRGKVKDKLDRLKQRTIQRINRSSSLQDADFSHLTRTKTRAELVRISAAVMGIEFSYAAETAFVSPLLLNLGLPRRHMTLMWLFSPLLGFFLTPILGSLSDGSRSKLGKRRPFIILLSVGIVFGLLLVPNGQLIGTWLGDKGFAAVQPRSTATSSDSGTIPLQSANSLARQTRSTRFSGDPLSADTTVFSDPPVSYKTGLKKLALDDSGRKTNSLHSPNVREEEDILKRIRLRPKEIPLLSTKNSSAVKASGTQVLSYLLKELEKQKRLDQTSEIRAYDKDDRNRNLSSSTIQLANLVKAGSGEDGPNEQIEEEKDSLSNHQWGLLFTVIGTILLDFDADACQSPSRAYMLDVTIPEDHARGLSTFTIMAGLGGSLGYFLGALNWENTFIGILFGGQVRAVFTLVLFIFIACVIETITSFQEIPIDRLYPPKAKVSSDEKTSYAKFEEEGTAEDEDGGRRNYGALGNVQETSFVEKQAEAGEATAGIGAVIHEDVPPTFKEYVKTIVQLPKSLQWLCVTNFFCWMSLVCYSLYFTDFVGQAVFGGDPFAPKGSVARTTYEDGVRFGCWGMSLYSLSCSIYSLLIESLVSRFGARRVYICGQLVYSVGMVFMGLARHPAGVIIFSWTAGIMYATLFTMPYLLVARYHAAETFDIHVDDLVQKPAQVRGLGTDVAIVSSMVFLAQMTQAVTLGSVVSAAGTTTAIVFAAAVFASCGALAATRVLYLDL